MKVTIRCSGMTQVEINASLGGKHVFKGSKRVRDAVLLTL